MKGDQRVQRDLKRYGSLRWMLKVNKGKRAPLCVEFVRREAQ